MAVLHMGHLSVCQVVLKWLETVLRIPNRS
jgi:hypothetical protein